MIRTLFTQILVSVLLLTVAQANSLDDLELRGKGAIRYLGIFKVYDAYLYTDSERSDKDVLSADCSRCLKIDYAMDLSANDIIEASEVVLHKQHEKSTLAGVRSELELLYRKYKDVRDGDSYTLCYFSETQTTTVVFNKTLLVEIPSPAFAAIYFGIWLFEKNAIDEGLRRQLLSTE